MVDIDDIVAHQQQQTIPANFDPETAENNEDIEKQFAVKAVQHLHIYWRLLETVPGSTLQLTRLDDEIYEHLQREFPDFDPSKPVDEDRMKGPDKPKWRKFMMEYEKKIDEYNFGTLVRTSPNVEYGEDTTIFVPRMQFYAIEIARNKNKLNDWVHEQAKKAKEAK